MQKTLTATAKTKMTKRFCDSLSHVSYKHNGRTKTIDILKIEQLSNTARIYTYFDDDIEGKITDLKVLDEDGDIAISSARIYNKDEDDGYPRGLYVVFRYKFEEELEVG